MILKSIGAYGIAIIAFSLFWDWFFDRPRDHEILIPVLTGFCSSGIACGIIEDKKIQDKNEAFAHYVIVGVVTTGFWLYQFYDTYNDLHAVEHNPLFSVIGSVIWSWEDLLMAVITFFSIVVINAPSNFSFDRLKNDVMNILDGSSSNNQSEEDRAIEEAKLNHFKKIKELAENGDVESMVSLGDKYYKGEGTEQNYYAAATWYGKAIDKGNTLAMRKLGKMYDNGIGVEQNQEIALKLYQQAADMEACHSVFLMSPGQEKVKVIKIIREITGLELKEAKKIVDDDRSDVGGSLIKTSHSIEECNDIKDKLEKVGATVEIISTKRDENLTKQ